MSKSSTKYGVGKTWRTRGAHPNHVDPCETATDAAHYTHHVLNKLPVDRCPRDHRERRLCGYRKGGRK